MHNIEEKKVSFYKLSKCLVSNEAFYEKCNGFCKKEIIKLPYLFIKNVYPMENYTCKISPKNFKFDDFEKKLKKMIVTIETAFFSNIFIF